MQLIEHFWTAVTTVISVITFTPLNDGGLDQVPLKFPSSTLLESPVAPHTEIASGPVFKPPGTPASSSFQCDYSAMTGWEPCSTELGRDCWLRRKSDGKRYDIFTDYETEWPTGTTRHYEFDVQDAVWDADGLIFPEAKLFNGSYPGPWIEACWGDRVSIKVTNRLKDNGTSVHWHGIRQLNSTHMDGVNGVTQCPIAPNDFFVYEFNVTQYGSSWYHSHYSVQYADGAAGPITLHGPASANYDEAISPPLIMTDWGHDSAFHAVTTGRLDDLDILLNGRGNISKFNHTVTPNAPIKPAYSITFEGPQKGKRNKQYLLRIINASFGSSFIFSIDNHMLKVVETDFVPVTPYTTKSLFIGIGQRYNIIVEANPTGPPPDVDDGNYWIRTNFSTCFSDPDTVPGDPHYEETGILRYNPSSKANPSSHAWPDIETDCMDQSRSDFPHPVVWWNIGEASNASPDGAGDGEGFNLTREVNNEYPLASWILGNQTTNYSLQINYSNITFLNLNNKGGWINAWRVQPEDFNSKDWVYMVIESFTGAHPIHLHGHDFAILKVSNTTFNPTEKVSLNKYNPPRRDVVLLPSGGYVVIAFKSDNPGTWLVHCHIAFHVSGGLGFQILEDQEAAAALWPRGSPAITEAQRVCGNWDRYCQGREDKCFQNDSGV